MTDIIRVGTGIKAVDSMIGGGLPKNSIVGLLGPAGVGKSIFAMQFVLCGAKAGGKSVFISLEEPRENIDRVLRIMDWGKEFRDYEKKRLISVLCISYTDLEKMYSTLFKKISNDARIKRLVIDSFNCFFSYCNYSNMSADDYKLNEMRKIMNASFSMFRAKELNTLLILEDTDDLSDPINRHIPFMVDGIIRLDFLSLGNLERRIFIPKMRWTEQYESSLPFKITRKGIVLQKDKDLRKDFS
ncbi:AAA family ATPase [Candidatus Woesearchaeota archaeon]|nr:AAA family ATPase [Candidatus Woesearchaeota archaeon]